MKFKLEKHLNERLASNEKTSYLTTGATVFAVRGDAGAKAEAALAPRTRAARVRRGAMVNFYEAGVMHALLA